MSFTKNNYKNLTFKLMKFKDFAESPDFLKLLSHYVKYSANPEFPPTMDLDFKPMIEAYCLQEERGRLLCLAVMDGQSYVGFAALILPNYGHLGVSIAFVDMWFILEAYKGFGTKMFFKIKQIAREMGCKGVIFSAPTGSALAKKLARVGVPTDSQYWISLQGRF